MRASSQPSSRIIAPTWLTLICGVGLPWACTGTIGPPGGQAAAAGGRGDGAAAGHAGAPPVSAGAGAGVDASGGGGGAETGTARPGGALEPAPPAGGAVGGGGRPPATVDAGGPVDALTLERSPPTCDVGIREIAAYQSVKVPLWRDGALVPVARAPLLAGRKTLLRVFVSPGPAFEPGTITVALSLSDARGTRFHERTVAVAGPSREGEPETSGNFLLAAGDLTAQTSLRVALSPEVCARATPSLAGPRQVPADAALPVGAEASAGLELVLVPMAYLADGSNRLPDTSAAQVERYRALLEAMFPIASSTITVRQPVGLQLAVTASQNWDQVLDGLRDLRARDAPGDGVYYMGLVVPAEKPQDYCGDRCVAGIAYNNTMNVAALRVGLALGYSGDASARALVHELGHTHGLGHAPCNAPEGVDDMFPYREGTTGVWGFDARRDALYDPGEFKDFMGYCEPTWISDYAYGKLLGRVRAIAFSQSLLVSSDGAVSMGYLGLQISANGVARWGAPWRAPQPAGTPEPAEVFDVHGIKVADITVYRNAIGDDAGALVLVPAPAPGWFSVAVRGALPLPFAGLRAPPVLQP